MNRRHFVTSAAAATTMVAVLPKIGFSQQPVLAKPAKPIAIDLYTRALYDEQLNDDEGAFTQTLDALTEFDRFYNEEWDRSAPAQGGIVGVGFRAMFTPGMANAKEHGTPIALVGENNGELLLSMDHHQLVVNDGTRLDGSYQLYSGMNIRHKNPSGELLEILSDRYKLPRRALRNSEETIVGISFAAVLDDRARFGGYSNGYVDYGLPFTQESAAEIGPEAFLYFNVFEHVTILDGNRLKTLVQSTIEKVQQEGIDTHGLYVQETKRSQKRPTQELVTLGNEGLWFLPMHNYGTHLRDMTARHSFESEEGKEHLPPQTPFEGEVVQGYKPIILDVEGIAQPRPGTVLLPATNEVQYQPLFR